MKGESRHHITNANARVLSITLIGSVVCNLSPRTPEFDWPRYKFAVQVTLGELRGEGVKMGCRNFWDPTTDDYAQEVYQNDSLYCVSVVFACYYP